MKSTQEVGLAALVLVIAAVAWDWRLLLLSIVIGLKWFLQPLTSAIFNAMQPEAVVESYFEDGKDPTKRTPFPSLVTQEKGDVLLSIIVPAYKEEKRLGKMLDTTLDYLYERERRNADFTFEVIVVDDGSTDNTYKVALSYAAKHGTNKVRVLKLARNHGKGGAVKKGMLRARGKLLLMADADGASRISDLERLEEVLMRFPNGEGMVFGSRTHLAEDEDLKRTGIRGFVSAVFHAVIVGFFVPGHIRDTQCGFKLFSRDVARKIFPSQRFYGWSFDCELLFLGRLRFKVPVSEAAIEWHDVAGSKLNVAEASLEMIRDVLLMSIMYRLPIW